MSQTTIYNKSKKLKQFLSNTTDREYNKTNMFEIRLNEIKTFKNRDFYVWTERFGPDFTYIWNKICQEMDFSYWRSRCLSFIKFEHLGWWFQGQKHYQVFFHIFFRFFVLPFSRISPKNEDFCIFEKQAFSKKSGLLRLLKNDFSKRSGLSSKMTTHASPDFRWTTVANLIDKGYDKTKKLKNTKKVQL